MRTEFFTFALLAALSLGAHAQDVKGTESVEDKAKRLKEAGRLPETVATSFGRKVADSHHAPWRAVGRVNIGGVAHCTGSLIAPDIVLTAAHCVYSQSQKRLVVPGIVHFVAGYTLGEYEGHSKVASYEVDPKFDGSQGPTPENLPYDWALLKLENPLGTNLGFLSLPGNVTTAPDTGRPHFILTSPIVTIAGYPGDRAHVLSLEEGCRIRAAAHGGHVLMTDCVAIEGDSGGPILQADTGDDGFHIIGIQTAGTKVENRVASLGVSVLAFWPALQRLQKGETPPQAD